MAYGSGEITYEELSPELQARINSGGTGAGVTIIDGVVTKKVVATEDEQTEFVLPFSDYDEINNYLDIKINSTWINPERYTLEGSKITLLDGVSIGTSIYFTLFSLGKVTGDGGYIENVDVAQTPQDIIVYDSESVSNPNLLVNGDFRIWQNGTTCTPDTSKSYTADQWLAWTTTDFTATRFTNSRGQYGMSILSGGNLNIGQYVEGVKFIQNQKVTLSFRASSDVDISLNAHIVDGNKSSGLSLSDIGYFNIGSTEKAYKYTFTVSANQSSDYFWFRFYHDIANCTLKISEVKLEFGQKATAPIPRPYQEELAICQRYFSISQIPQIPVVTDNTQLVVPIYFPVPMRVVPTFTALTNIYGHYTGTSTGVVLLREAGWSKGVGETYGSLGQMWIYNETSAPAEIINGEIFVLNASASTNNRLSAGCQFSLDARIF